MVNAIDVGKIVVDAEAALSTVQYLIFELAEGDIRTRLDKFDRFDLALGQISFSGLVQQVRIFLLMIDKSVEKIIKVINV